MPQRLTTPVLTVDAGKIHNVDTRNAESLHGMWMVFSKCSDLLEEGKRLENLSWRLWNRETFCVEPEQSQPQSQPRSQSSPRLRGESKEVPELSTSVESAASDEAERIESHIRTPSNNMDDATPDIVAEDQSLSVSRGREKHITSLGLEKMVYNIKENKSLEPLEPQQSCQPTQQQQQQQTVDITPQPASPTATNSTVSEQNSVRPHQSSESCSTAALDGNDSENPPAVASDTSVSSAGLTKSPSVVKGFSPSHISSSYRSQPRLNNNQPTSESSKASLPVKSTPVKKKGGMFTLGCSSGDEESSFEDRLMAKPHRSSLTDGLNRNPARQEPKKVTSFKNEPIKPIRENSHDADAAIETDDEDDDDDEISESAIDDDEDESEWEDSITESGRSSPDNNKPLFQRVDSRPNLVSRPSLLTMMMHQPTRNGGPQPGGQPGPPGSRSTPALQRRQQQQLQQQQHQQIPSPNHKPTTTNISAAVSPDDDDENTLTMKGPDMPRSKPIITKPIPCHSVAHSPRTTRRNMLATELTESLRRHLLMERQQKTTAATTTPFRRRHTAHDMGNLQEYPNPHNDDGKEEPPTTRGLGIGQYPTTRNKDTSKNNSWNHYFDYGPWEYHEKGW